MARVPPVVLANTRLSISNRLPLSTVSLALLLLLGDHDYSNCPDDKARASNAFVAALRI
jgi:hypothetical protein